MNNKIKIRRKCVDCVNLQVYVKWTQDIYFMEFVKFEL